MYDKIHYKFKKKKNSYFMLRQEKIKHKNALKKKKKCLLLSEKANLKKLHTVWFPTLLHFGKGRTMTVKWLFLQGNIVNWLPQDPSKIPIQPGSSSISYFSVMFQTLKNKI